MLNISTETILTFCEARNRLPRRRRGKRPDVSTLYRWSQVGLKGVRLETLKIGGQTCTSIEALQRFFDRLSCGHSVQPQPTVDDRRTSVVEEALERIGI